MAIGHQNSHLFHPGTLIREEEQRRAENELQAARIFYGTVDSKQQADSTASQGNNNTWRQVTHHERGQTPPSRERIGADMRLEICLALWGNMGAVASMNVPYTFIESTCLPFSPPRFITLMKDKLKHASRIKAG